MMMSSSIMIDQELCTGCRRCAKACPVDAIQGTQGEPQRIDESRCVLCGQCVQTCSAFDSLSAEETMPRKERLAQRGMPQGVKEPLFAAYCQSALAKVKAALADASLHTLVQCAPAVRVAIAEDFGLELGSLTPGKLVAGLRRLGFDRVYDTNFAADLTIMEEGSELLARLQNGGVLPMFTSCCPAWVKHVEQEYPQLIPHLSSCKSPQQMAGALFKTYGAKIDNLEPQQVYSVAIMPCTCKPYEAARPELASEGRPDVDAVLTTRELAYLLKEAKIDFAALPDEEGDAALGLYSGAGHIFGATGGVMEAALRTAWELVNKKPLDKPELEFIRGGEGIRSASLTVGGQEVKVAIVAGLQHAKPLLEQVAAGNADYHFIEVMTCPVGCVSGGGQPKVLLPEDRVLAYANRTAATYGHDAQLKTRKSHENPAIQQLYKEFLGEPLGHTSHHLLHTTYTDRRKPS
ncbi:[FeFe] hydrogenase, group A [Azotosporobacter soli]|uniref:[FeFe] hydrogenase, group A n=1 Tax=Azotosporobacter soli TaxID=3055040 RepID=UPI0031FE9848